MTDGVEDRSADEIIADPNHPIYKIMLLALTIIGAIYGASSEGMI
tara:strand:- start:155 stop:289 length:135 start_codon:yes stop_codon:yes gene_type:complete